MTTKILLVALFWSGGCFMMGIVVGFWYARRWFKFPDQWWENPKRCPICLAPDQHHWGDCPKRSQ
jgi:hypothetical protein